MSSTKGVDSEKRILWIVPRVPWPPSCGASVANCALISAMAEQGWKIDLLCLARSCEVVNQIEIREKLGLSSIEVIRFPILMRFIFTRILVSFLAQLRFRDVPLTVIPYVAGRVGRALLKRIMTASQRIILWDGLHPMAAFTRMRVNQKSLPKEKAIHFYRAHNCESVLWNQYIAKVSCFLKPLVSAQAKAMAKLERKCLSSAAMTLCISESDKKLLCRLHPENLKLMTLPVSIRSKNIVSDGISSSGRRGALSGKYSSLKLLWMGGMDWWPNKEGLHWFLKKVWPSLGVGNVLFKLDVIGKGTQQLRSIDSRGIDFHGFVPDPTPYLLQTDLLIVPIFSGAGIRIKALEAITHGIPCLGTSAGLSGIPEDGCWVRQTSQDWRELLMNITPEICRERGYAGLRSVQQTHSPEVIGAQLDGLFSRALQQS